MLKWIKRLLGKLEPSHNVQDSDCRYWTGDRAGYDLRTVCSTCRTERDR